MSGIDIPEEMKAKYIERRKQDYDDCIAAFDKSDYEVFLRIGHQLKGNASSFGFDDLGMIATEIEHGAQLKDLSALKISLKKFDAFLQRKTNK